MSTIKSSFPNMVLTLTIVTLVASLMLGFVYEYTKEPIEKALLNKQLKAIETVISGYDNNPVQDKFAVAVEKGVDSLEFFPATLKGEFLGVAVKAKSEKGYSGEIWLMVGFQQDGTINNIFVIRHLETPGLGSKMSDPVFINQYKNRHPGKANLSVKKDGGEIDAISGATISSRAFSEAVMSAYKAFEQSGYGKD